MIGKEDYKQLLNVVFSALSFLLAPLALLLLRRPWTFYLSSETVAQEASPGFMILEEDMAEDNKDIAIN